MSLSNRLGPLRRLELAGIDDVEHPVRDGILSRLVRCLARAAARVYYPDIEISGREFIPPAGPLLLAANHQNSLIDPVLVGLVASRPVRFLAKATLFELPVVGLLLHALGMVPIHRRDDDPRLMHRNFELLRRAADRLRQGEAVGIFPEGKSHDAPRIEPIKSGAARLAIQAVRAGAGPLRLVPVGLNYQRKEQFRSAVWIRVGEPIDVNAWVDRSDAAAEAAEASKSRSPVIAPDEPVERELRDRSLARELSTEVDRRLRQLVVDLDDPSCEPFLRDLELLLPPPDNCRRNPFAWLRQRQRLADAINHFSRADPERARSVANRIEHGRARLEAVGLNPRSAVLRWRGWRLAARLVSEGTLMTLGLLLVLVGTLHHLVPFLITRGLARLLRAPGRSVVALARVGVGLPIYAGWYALHAWWISGYFLPWLAWAWLVPMPFAGLLALRYWRRVKRTSPGWWGGLFLAAQPKRLAAVRSEYAELQQALEELSAEFSRHHPAEPLPQNSFSWRRLAWAASGWMAVAVVAFFVVAWLRTWLADDELAEFGRPAPAWSAASAETVAATVAADELILVEAIGGLKRLKTESDRLQAEFLSRRRDFYSQADDDAIRRAMLGYLTLRTTLLGLSWKYQRYEEMADERLRQRAFLVLVASASAISDASLELVVRFAPHPDSVRKLNEGDAAWGLPPGLFDRVRADLQQDAVRRFMDESLVRYQASGPEFARLNLTTNAPHAGFHAVVQGHASTRQRLMAEVATSPLVKPIDEAGRMTRGLAYRGQSFVSTWLGSTRFRQPRDGRPMIAPAQLAEFRAKLRPGDILIERQNWFLSRAFMPGYWAHAALYVGDTNDLIRLGLDRDARVMARWREFAARDSRGHEHLILEAVPEGVRMTTLEHCIGVADAAAAMRPRLDEAQIREAIARAFTHLGKAYDFDFDFFTSDRLVCTELVYRAYDGALRFPLVDVMGRKTLPPTELVRKFVLERGGPGAQLDCVCFLDGDERRGRADFCDEEVFSTTIERPGLILVPGAQR